MSEKISESRFFMWRSIFAIAHADEIVTSEERTFMNKIMMDQPFSETQLSILQCDIEQKQDIKFLFGKISDQQDRSEFFNYARTLVWADGDFGTDEQELMTQLSKMHMKSANLDTLREVGHMALEDSGTPIRAMIAPPQDGFVTRILKAIAGVS
jgi:hypothetical protein